MNKIRIAAVCIFLFQCSQSLMGQVSNSGLMDTSSGERIKNIAIGAYLDVYYGYHFNRTINGNVQYFVNSNRHNELNINLAYLDVRYQTERVRGRFVPGFGTYMDVNYSQETCSLRHIVEASAGFKPFPKKKIWIDAGVLGSPYTNESAISKDHLMYSRSLAPEYVPYYLSGIKLSMPFSEKVFFYGYLLNGWQQIRDQNNQKAIGTQLEFRPDRKNLFNWNTYFGDERHPERPEFRMRYFTDVYWIHNPEGKLSFTSCAYLGFQTGTDHPKLNKNTAWWQANLISRFRFNSKHSISGRVEYFSDPNSIQVIPLNPSDGFEVFGSGLCYNYLISKEMMFRLEGRHLISQEKIFNQQKDQVLAPVNDGLWILTNLTFWF